MPLPKSSVSRWTSGFRQFFYYALGCLCWFILLGILQSNCIVNIPHYIDSLWLKPVGEDLVKNLIGATAFRVEGCGCEDQLIFIASYYSNAMGDESKMKSLTSTIDLDSWEKAESDSITTTYIDHSYKYILYKTSDGFHMKVYEK